MKISINERPSMQNQLPETIGEILSFFDGISFHGIDLAWALCDHFSMGYATNTLHIRDWKKELIYGFLKMRYPLFVNSYRHRTFTTIQIPQADAILLSSGVQRGALLSFPILYELHSLNRLIVFTHPKIYLPGGPIGNCLASRGGSISDIMLNSIPFSFREWVVAVSQLWTQINRQTDKLCRTYKFSQAYGIVYKLCEGIATIMRAEALFQAAHPKLIISEFDRQSQDALIIEVAKQRDIKSATLVHGLQGSSSFASSLWAPLVADRVIVWGKWMQGHFEKQGVPPEKISIGGYTRISYPDISDRETAVQHMLARGWNGRDPVVVLVSSSLDDKKSAVEMVIKALASLPQFYFMVRPHPQEELDWYKDNLPGGLTRIQDAFEWTLAESLASADIVVGSASTACLDALLVGKSVILVPDIFVNYSDAPMLVDAVERCVVMTADSSEELAAKLTAFDPSVKNDIAAQFARESALFLGGEAARQSAMILRAMIEW